MSRATIESIKKSIREAGFKVQKRTSKFASEHEEEIEKVKKGFSDTKNKIEETKVGKKVKENTDKFSLDHEEEISKYKKRVSDAKLKLEFTVINTLAEKRDDEKIDDETSESGKTLSSMDTNDDKEDPEGNKVSDKNKEEGEIKNGDKVVIESDKHANAIYPEVVQKLGFQLDVKESLSSDFKEAKLLEKMDQKANYLKPSKKEDSKQEKKSKEKVSTTLKAKLLSAKANLTAFLEKNKKEINEKEEAVESNNCDVKNTLNDKKVVSTTEVANFVATAETTSKNTFEKARDALKKMKSAKTIHADK